MKTHLKLALLILALAATAGSAFAQRTFLRADLSVLSADDGPYDTAGGGISIAAGTFLDAGQHHEVSLSLGFLAWEESELRGHHYSNNNGTTTIRIADNYYDIPNGNAQFSFKNEQMKLSDGTTYNSDYRPSLLVMPLMANYRVYLGEKDARVRIFLGAGAGFASTHIDSELWGKFQGRHSGSQTDSDWGFTWNATAGASIKLIERLRLDASFVYQEIEGADFKTSNIVYNLEKMKTGAVRAGVTWLF